MDAVQLLEAASVNSNPLQGSVLKKSNVGATVDGVVVGVAVGPDVGLSVGYELGPDVG
jgi:hypothetical protein